MGYKRAILIIIWCWLGIGCSTASTPAATDTAVPSAVAIPVEQAQNTPDESSEPTLASTAEATAIVAKHTATPTPVAQNTVLFQSVTDGSVRAIDLASGDEIVLADPTEANQRLPWRAAPDGQSIAVITGHGFGGSELSDAALWTVNIDGSAPQKLLDLLGNESAAPDDLATPWLSHVLTGEYQRLNWTPDGREIIVSSAHEGQVDLYAVAVDGSGLRRLTHTPAFEFQATLAPSGEYLAYGSTTSFGTGAGWADVQAQLLNIVDGPIQPLIGPTNAAPTAAHIVGWTDKGQVLVASSDNGAGTTSMWLTLPGQLPYIAVQVPYVSAMDLQADSLAYAVHDLAQAQPQSSIYTWDIQSTAEPKLLVQTAAIDFLRWSPEAAALVLCENQAAPDTYVSLWHNEQLTGLGSANCNHLAWSADAALAMGGVDKGIVYHNGSHTSLPAQAIPAGWHADSIYYFSPTDEQTWQLYQQPLNGTAVAIGTPITFEPHQPQLVKQ